MKTYTNGLTSAGDILGNRKDAIKEFLKPFRHKLFDNFHRRLNTDRLRDGKKPLSMKALAIKLSLYSDDELDYIYKQCSEARNFSSLFWWITNPKNAKPTRPR